MSPAVATPGSPPAAARVHPSPLTPRPAQPWTRIDTRWLVALALLAAAARLPFLTAYAYSWDTANFVLALQQQDLWLDLPHPTGYILWLGLGWLGMAAGLDAHIAFQLWNVLAAALGTALIYRLGWRMGDRRVALGAALLFLTSPVTWFYAGTAYADPWDATLALGIALLAWEQRRSPSLKAAAAATLLYSLAGGIRQQNLLFLFPLWAWAVWPLPARGRLGMVALLAAVSAAWVAPLVAAAGGPVEYLRVVQRHAHHAQRHVWTSPAHLRLLGDNLGCIFGAILLGVPAALAALPLFGWHMRHRRPARGWLADVRIRFLALWCALPVAFFLLVYLNARPGLFLGMLPALMLATAFAAARIRIPPGRLFSESPGTKLLVGGISLNLLLFLALPTPTSRAELATHDRRLAAEYAAIRRRFPPESTLLISHTNWYWYSARHAALHLPEYEVWYLDEPDPGRWWTMRHHRTRLLAEATLPERVRTLVFIHDHRRSGRRPVPHSDASLMEVPESLVRREPLPAQTYLCWMPVTPADRKLLYSPQWQGPRLAPPAGQSSSR